MTLALRQLLTNNANEDDLIAFMNDRRLPVEDIEATRRVFLALRKKLDGDHAPEE